MKKKVLALIMVCLMGVALVGCGGSDNKDAAPANRLEQIKAAGKIIVGTDPTWPPFEYIGANGEIAGAEMEIAEAIAAAIGVEVEYLNTTFDSLPTCIANNDIDIILSAMTITEERSETIQFSIPMIEACQYVVVPVEDTNVKSMEDMGGYRIGSQLGTTGDFMVADEIDLEDGVLHGTGASYQQYKTVADAVLDMKSGSLDAIVCDTLLAKNICVVNPELQCFPASYTTPGKEVVVEEIGAGMPKDEPEFTAVVNEVIQGMLDDGSMEEVFNKHMELSAEL